MNDLSNRFSGSPFVRLLIPLIAGIVLAEWLFPPKCLYLFLIPFLFSLNLLFLKSKTPNLEYFKGVILILIFLSLGFSLAVNNRYDPQKLNGKEFNAFLEEYPVEKEKSYRAVIRLTEPDILVLAYFEKTKEIFNAQPGTLLHITGCPELIRNNGNPFEFDFRAYSLRNKIGHRIFLKQEEYHFFNNIKIMSLRHHSLVLREKFLLRLGECGVKDETYKVISAITLGARDNIDPETTESFAKTGTLHILAVSGGNVAVVFFLLHVLFGFLRRRGTVIVYLFIILAGIWGYAVITGLSPSVLRAATMFSFIVIGFNLRRDINIYNCLASSAFILICIKPAILFDAGFQLSYAAVFAIIFLQPFIYRLVYFKYSILDKTWVLLSVSLAAQLGTLPFSLYYFHQFPNYFWLSNLVVVPLVAVFLYLTFFIIIIAPLFPALGALAGILLNWTGEVMLKFLQIVEDLPYAVIENIYPSAVQITLTTTFLILTVCYIAYQKKEIVLLALSLLTVLLFIQTGEIYRTHKRKEIVVFNVPGKTLLAFTAGNKTIWISSEKSPTEYFTKPYEGFRRIKRSEKIFINELSDKSYDNLRVISNFINFNGLRVFLMPYKYKIDGHFPKTDVLLLSGIRKENYNEIQEDLMIDAEMQIVKITYPISLIQKSPLPGNPLPGEGQALKIRVDHSDQGNAICRPGYFNP